MHVCTEPATVAVSDCSVAFQLIDMGDGFPRLQLFGGRFLDCGYLCRLRAHGRSAHPSIYESEQHGRPLLSLIQVIYD